MKHEQLQNVSAKEQRQVMPPTGEQVHPSHWRWDSFRKCWIFHSLRRT